MKSKLDEETAARSDAEVGKKQAEDLVKQLREKASKATSELEDERTAHAALKKKVAILLGN